MGRPGYSRRHYRLLSNGGADSSERVAERLAYAEALADAIRGREARFPVLTPENAAEAIAWTEARIKELLAAGVR